MWNDNNTRNLALATGAAVLVGLSAAYWYRARGKSWSLQNDAVYKSSSAQSTEPVQHRPVRVPIPKRVREPTSFGNFHECVVTHMALDLKVNFNRQVISGSVVLTAEVKKDGVDTLVLDTRNLTIQKVKLGGGARGPRDLEYSFGTTHENYGTAIKINLPSDARTKGSKLLIQVQYETAAGSDCSAAQWLPASQTAGKKHPYLFTQCQAIHCRSLVPCQDAPACKTTYEAAITVPNPLVALMSAVATKSEIGVSHSIYHFRQSVPMAPYLLALAVGNLESRDIGPRTRLWSEPSVVEFGAYEFADTERFLRAAEQICGPYVWGRYDLLLLPPSFPYGGMENPCLTFVTPTLLAGDQSLANVVAHEIAHSWMGNLVTNANWEDFWMNEGFTVFVERRIIAKLFGEQRAGLKSVIGWQHLEEAVKHFGENHEFTRLHIPMEDVDPDDSFSSIPYEKGCAFLTYLEQLVGGPQEFEPFMRAHVQRFQYGTVNVDEWKKFFLAYFKDSIPSDTLDEIDWDTWINAPGLPPVKVNFDTTLIEDAHRSADEWVDKKESKVEESWSSDQKVVFLERILSRVDADGVALPEKTFQQINASYGFTETRNSELRFRWYTLGCRLGFEFIYDDAVQFLTEQGRMKFVRPLYRDLYNSGARGKEVAVKTFMKHRSSYHAIAQKMIGRDLSINQSEDFE